MNEIVELVIQAQSGCKVAANALAERFQHYVYKQSLLRLRNHTDAETVTQEVLTRAFIKINQLEIPRAYSSWLKQMTHRVSLNYIKFRRKNTEFKETAGKESDVSDVFLRHEESESVRKAVSKLNKMDRCILKDFYFDQKSVKEIAKKRVIPVGTVKRRLYVARCNLREHYKLIMKNSEK
jgi:RNA polymerase sigma-70 factor (ECF subfamily)